MRKVINKLDQWTRDGEEIALATVVETWGSSPRPLGSKMVVTRSGKMAGSVSNGCIEGAVFEEAQKVLKSGKPKVAAFGVADDVAFEGSGELLRVVSPPAAGARDVDLDAATGSIDDETYVTVPTSSVDEPLASQQGKIALTFDAGPAAARTQPGLSPPPDADAGGGGGGRARPGGGGGLCGPAWQQRTGRSRRRRPWQQHRGSGAPLAAPGALR